MLPPLEIADYTLSWYSVVIVFTVCCCILFFYYLCLSYLPTKVRFFEIAGIIVFLTLAGFAGARLLAALELFLNNSYDDFWHVLFEHAGLSWFGGLLLDLCLIYIGKVIFRNRNVMKISDLLAVTCCLGYGLGRFACLLSGDGCYGTWTSLPWGMHFIYGNNPSFMPVHPTPLYESIIHLVLVAFLLRLLKRQSCDGYVLFGFLGLTSISRFCIEYIRVNDKILWDLSTAQLVSIGLIIISLYSQKKLTPINRFNFQP